MARIHTWWRVGIWAESERLRLDQMRLAVLEDRVDAYLTSGHDETLVAELRAAVSVEPLRERLRGQLMLAFYRAGRQADALSCYQEGRKLLADELGVEPGPALTSVHD